MPYPDAAKKKGNEKSWKELGRARRTVAKHEKRFATVYENLIKAGLTDSAIGAVFGMGKSGTNLCNERDRTPSMIEAYEKGMSQLESSLTGRIAAQAIGYDYTEEKIVQVKKDGKWVDSKREIVTKHNPGSAQMMTFLMTNKFSDNWKQTKELVTKKEGYDKEPGQRAKKQIESLARNVLEADTVETEGEHTLSDRPTPVSS